MTKENVSDNFDADEVVVPDTNLNDSEQEFDESEVITDDAELSRYLTEQELLRKTAELTAEQMLSVDDNLLTPEQLRIKTEWRDAVIVLVLAEGVKESFHKIITGQGNGTIKNNKFYDGYKQSLNDIYEKLMAIVPEDYKEFNKRLEAEQAQKIADFNEKVGSALDERTEETNESITDN